MWEVDQKYYRNFVEVEDLAEEHCLAESVVTQAHLVVDYQLVAVDLFAEFAVERFEFVEPC